MRHKLLCVPVASPPPGPWGALLAPDIITIGGDQFVP